MNERQVRMGEIFGYAFKNDALLEEALTTPSYRMTCPKAKDNQRLEFLGDAVLDFLAADQLFASCPGDSEGPLTVKRTHMVSSPALCAFSARSCSTSCSSIRSLCSSLQSSCETGSGM